MGWRTDQAYEQAQREEYRRWRASLTVGQRLAFELIRARHFLLGLAAAAAIALAIPFLT